MTRDGRMDDKEHPELRWLERGDGEPVILLHGLMGRMDHWETSLEELGDFCRAIAPSLPIYDARLPEPSIGELARHVVRFLDALEIPGRCSGATRSAATSPSRSPSASPIGSRG